MSDKEEVRKIDINIPGDNNTFVANADTVNISSANNVILVGEELKKIHDRSIHESCRYGRV